MSTVPTPADITIKPEPEPEPPWISPGNALARVIGAVGQRSVAIETIIGRLKAGLLKATFERHEWENVHHPPKIDPNFIDKSFWRHYDRSAATDHVWMNGDLRLYVGGTYSQSMIETSGFLTFFRVKIERVGIDEIVANATHSRSEHTGWVKKPREIAPPPPAPEPVEPERKGLRVSDAHLEAWYELFKWVYGETPHDTEAFAHKSALGMFPDKPVTRQQIRDLRPDQKRGPKPKNPAK